MNDDVELPKTAKAVARYKQIIEAVFHRYWKDGATEFVFGRDDLRQVCEALKIEPPKNLGDIIYAFRYRQSLPRACSHYLRASTISAK